MTPFLTLQEKIDEAVSLSDRVGASRGSNCCATNERALSELVDLELEIKSDVERLLAERDSLWEELRAWVEKMAQPEARSALWISGAALPGRGWVCEHDRYGTWFISREAVIEDWKQDRKQAYPDAAECEPHHQAVQTWFNEQISWIEIHLSGVQLKRPDVAAHEAGWLFAMSRDTDGPQVVRPVKASVR